MAVKITENDILNANVKKKGKDEIKDKLSKVDSKYTIQDINGYVPEKFDKGEKLEYDKPTKEEVEKQATDSLEDYKNSSITSINKDYDKKLNDVNYDIQDSSFISKQKQDDIKKHYDNELKTTVNKNIKRGLANSSIFDNAIELNSQNKDKAIKLEKEDFEIKLNSLNGEKNVLEKQKETALKNFDISYAVKLNNKIDNLNKEIAKEEERVTKYNNQLLEDEKNFHLKQEEQRQKYEKDVAIRNKKLVDLMNDVGIIGLNKLKYQEKYEILLDYFNSMPKAEALKELGSDKYYEKEISIFYPSLYAEMLNRKD